MVIGVALGSVGALLLGSFLLSRKGYSIGSSSSVSEVLDNSKKFADKYIDGSMVTVESEYPYTSSNLISRPHTVLNYKAQGLDDDDVFNGGGGLGSSKTFGGGFLSGASVATFLDGSSTVGREFPWVYALVFGLGVYSCYRLVN